MTIENIQEKYCYNGFLLNRDIYFTTDNEKTFVKRINVSENFRYEVKLKYNTVINENDFSDKKFVPFLIIRRFLPEGYKGKDFYKKQVSCVFGKSVKTKNVRILSSLMEKLTDEVIINIFNDIN